VDDDETVRGVTAEMVEMLGHSVLGAASADEALTLLDASKPDVMLIDIGLQGMSGAQLARAVRQERPEIGLVYATGQDAPLDAPPGAMLRKPYGSAEMAAVLKPFL
jgi:CheY-like chemotaxis protein